LEEVEYCGHKINAEGLHESQKGIQAILEATCPTNVTEVKALCGFVQYYNKFLPNTAQVLYNLYALTKKSKRWKWTKECEQAFKEAKRLVASGRVLVHYNPNLSVLLACDA
jgi:hypothetical protein